MRIFFSISTLKLLQALMTHNKALTTTLSCVLQLDTISEPLDMNEAYILMPGLFDFGIHSGDPLSMLQNKLANVKTQHKAMHSAQL